MTSANALIYIALLMPEVMYNKLRILVAIRTNIRVVIIITIYCESNKELINNERNANSSDAYIESNFMFPMTPCCSKVLIVFSSKGVRRTAELTRQKLESYFDC